MGKKLPAILFYPGDWLKDPALSLCSPATRGIWFDLLCAMHELGRCGHVAGTPEQLSRISRCTTADVASAIAELKSTGAADVHERNGVVTLVNRRMNREAKERQSAAARQVRSRANRKLRDSHVDNNECHSPISISSSISISKETSIDVSENTMARDPPATRSKFVPPTAEEVRAYCAERGNSIDPEHFVEYYRTRGWVLGRGQKMKDWRSAVITWEKNDRARKQQQSDRRVGPGQRFSG